MERAVSAQARHFLLLEDQAIPLQLVLVGQEATLILLQAHLVVILYLAQLLQMAGAEAGQTQIRLLVQTVALVAEQDAQVVQTPVELATRHLLIPRKDQTAEITALAHQISAPVAVAAHLLWVRTELAQPAATVAPVQPHLFLAAA